MPSGTHPDTFVQLITSRHYGILVHDNIANQFSTALTKSVYPLYCHTKLLPQYTIVDKYRDPWDCSLSASKSRLQSFLSVTSHSLSRAPYHEGSSVCSLGTPSKCGFSTSSTEVGTPKASLPQVAGGTKWWWTVWMTGRYKKIIVCFLKNRVLIQFSVSMTRVNFMVNLIHVLFSL